MPILFCLWSFSLLLADLCPVVICLFVCSQLLVVAGIIAYVVTSDGSTPRSKDLRLVNWQRRETILGIICTVFPHINTPGVLLLSHLKFKHFYLINAAVRYYLRVCYYFYSYKQLYVISFLFFDSLAIVSRTTLLFTASNNTAQ